MKPATVAYPKSSDFSESSGNFLGSKLTCRAVVNQIKFQKNTQRVRDRSAASRALYGVLCLICALLAGCEPSPASQALKTRQPAATETPAALQDKPELARDIPELAQDQPAPSTEFRSAESPVSAPAPDESDTTPAAPPAQTASEPVPAQESDPADGRDFVLLGETIAPGTSKRLMWSASEIFEGVSSETPVLIVNGHRTGPTLCLTAAIHGDELNGIEMVRRVLHDLDPNELNGVVIGIPIVNLQGFRRGSRYLPDRRDLNRYFPGNPLGSSAARIAYSLFEEIIRKCDSLVDLHTGSFYRTNLPQLRADLRYTQIKKLTQGFGGIAVLHSVAAPGTLRRAATDAGIPSITLEAGEPLRLHTAQVNQGVNGMFKLLNTLDMVKRVQLLGRPEPVFYESTWVRADNGGILFTVVRLGQKVAAGDVLGTVTDPITNEQNLVYSPENGRILGMALNQVVMPGFAAFRIGIETDGLPSDSSILATDQEDDFELPMPTAAKEGIDDRNSAALGEPEETSEE